MHDGFDDAERRLAAIMAADVVGFSRMVGTDKAATMAGLRRARGEVIDAVVARHRGRIFKVMGDGLLMEFPSSLLALRAAVAIQTGLRLHNAEIPAGQRMVLRIGIHQGDVLVQGDDLLGDGVNIAARLESLSPPGGICVSARVREDAYGKADMPFEDGGERTLKNIARPMRVFFLYPDDQGTVTAHRSPPSGAGSPHHDGGDATLYIPVASRRHSLLLIESGVPGPARGHVVALGQDALTLGRQLPSGLLLPGHEVSRVHCRVELTDGAVVVTDLRSTNGTFVDDHRIEAPTRLRPGATFRVGPYVIRYVLDTATDAAETTHVMRV